VKHNQDIDDKEARFNALVQDAERDITARKTYGPNCDEPYDPIRALVVNSLCLLLSGLLFLILAAPLLNSGILACFVGIILPAAICIKIISSDTLARWVVSGAVFFLIGMLVSLLLIILSLPGVIIAAAIFS
jgi:hypothetical protein